MPAAEAVTVKPLLAAKSGASIAAATTSSSSPIICQPVRAVDGTKNKKESKRTLPSPPIPTSSKQCISDDATIDYNGDRNGRSDKAKTTALQVASNYKTALEAAGEGARIAPCHARGMPKNHNAKVKSITQHINVPGTLRSRVFVASQFS